MPDSNPPTVSKAERALALESVGASGAASFKRTFSVPSGFRKLNSIMACAATGPGGATACSKRRWSRPGTFRRLIAREMEGKV